MDDLRAGAPPAPAAERPKGELPLTEVAVALVEHEGRALVLRRSPHDRSFAHAWCLPGGRLDPGESPKEALRREVFEETGLRVEPTDALGPRRIVGSGGTPLAIHRFVARAKGDRVVLSEEHVAFRWLTRLDAALASHRLPGGLGGEIAAELLERFARGA